MSRDFWGIVSGLVVLALGVTAVNGLIRPEEQPVEAAAVVSPIPPPVSITEGPPVSIAPELPGVSSRISRVLEWNGDAGFAGDEELAQLPPTVAAVLTQYGVPLRVAVIGEAG